MSELPEPRRAYDSHAQSEALAATSVTDLFDLLDDPQRLGGHMERRFWRTLGTRMGYRFDARGGRAVGSRMSLEGDLWGWRVGVEQQVVAHDPPHRKAWETLGEPRLIVVGHYRMGFEIHPATAGSVVRVWLDYCIPSWRPRAIARALAAGYASWCVRQMTRDAVRLADAVNGSRAARGG